MDVANSSFSMTSAILGRTIADLREQIATTTQETATGRHADQVKALDGRVGDALLAKKAVEDVEIKRVQLSIRSARLQIAQNSLSSIAAGVEGLGSKMIAAVGQGDQPTVNLASKDARAALDDMLAALSVRHGERFLFSGEATSTSPFINADVLISDVEQLAMNAVDATDFANRVDAYFDDPTGGWRQTVYQGGLNPPDAESLLAVDPRLSKVAAALVVMSLGGEEPQPSLIASSSSILSDAAKNLIEAQEELVKLRSDQGRIQSRIETEKASLDAEETALTSIFNSLTARDPFEAATKLRELERNLEAAYLLTSRISSLSLTNFLR